MREDFIYRLNKDAARFFYRCGLKSQEFADYFAARKLTEESRKRFKLGFAPSDELSLVRHLAILGYTEAEMVEAGVAKRTRRGTVSVFVNRFMIPILDADGNFIAFGGRRISDEADENGEKVSKYINTASTSVYVKGNHVFSLNVVREYEKGRQKRNKPLLLCEGYLDVITLHQAGFPTAVAGLGTALTSEQARLISQHRDIVYLAYDSDKPGQVAARKAATLFHSLGTQVFVVSSAPYKDFDEACKNEETEWIKDKLKNAVPVKQWLIALSEKEKDVQKQTELLLEALG